MGVTEIFVKFPMISYCFDYSFSLNNCLSSDFVNLFCESDFSDFLCVSFCMSQFCESHFCGLILLTYSV